MTQKSKTAASLTGDFISENAVRGALGRRRTTQSADGGGEPVAAPAGRRSPGRTPLRRWSVAELIAAGIGRQVNGLGH